MTNPAESPVIAAPGIRPEKGGGQMRFYKGCWHYQGKTYATLRAALLAAWPK